MSIPTDFTAEYPSTANNATFVGIGEVLFDVFEDGSETLGGAPLNVAVHAHQLAAPLGAGRGIVVSCVGDDSRGKEIRRGLRQRGMDPNFIAVDAARQTGRVSVSMGHGEPVYQIEADVAWDRLQDNASLQELAARCHAISFGSLAQRSPKSRLTIRDFLEKATNAVRLYDANLRESTITAEKGYNAEIVDTSCRLATIIKANCSELRIMCGLLGIGLPDNGTDDGLRRGMEMLLARYAVDAVVLTRGAKGTSILTPDNEITAGSASIEGMQMHPVGAGDACSAGILFARVMGWDDVSAIELANRMGAWVASQQSATPALPDSILEFARDSMSVHSVS
jgi:fructokinase